jgi:hypothetical protein
VPADDAVPLATEIVTTACDHIQTVKHASTHLQQVCHILIVLQGRDEVTSSTRPPVDPWQDSQLGLTAVIKITFVLYTS